MKYQVDIDKMAQFIRSRPAAVKIVTDLTEAFVLKVLSKDFRRSNKVADFYQDLPIELKTLAVTRKYIKISPSWGFQYNIIPQAIRDQLTSDDRMALLDKRVSLIKELDNTTHKEWAFVLKKGFNDYKEIPEGVWNKSLILQIIRDTHFSFDIDFNTPGIWDEKFAEDIVEANDRALKIVPTHLITNQVFRKACRQDLSGIQIPTDAWDEECVDATLEDHPRNIKYVPKHLLTKEIVLKCARQGLWTELPYRDYDTLVHYMASNPNFYYTQQPKDLLKMLRSVNPKKFIPDTAKLGADPDTLKRFGMEITESMWLKILEINPKLLKQITKPEQTEAMVETFFSNAGCEIIDELDEKINLGKIKAHHAPLLVNCKSELLSEIRNKFMKGDEEKGGDNTMEIDIGPSQFAKIKGLLVGKLV